MICGSKLEGRFHSYFERLELAERLENEGEYRLADKVKRGDCLDGYELRHAERALESQGLSRHFDYKIEDCHCSTEEEY